MLAASQVEGECEMPDQEPPKAPTGPMPPYIAFKTLTDVIERMERDGAPTRVDPSWLDSYAGGYRPTVIGNLHTLGLLSKAGEPTEDLLNLVAADEGTRKQLIGNMVQKVYADVLALPLNSTQSQFLEVFSARGAAGDTRRKAVSFFLKACKHADLPVGGLWKTPPASANGTTRRRTPKEKQDPIVQEDSNAAGGSGQGEVVVVGLGAAGTVTVNVDVKWLQLDDPTFTALRAAIKSLRELATPSATPEPEPSANDEPDDELDEVSTS
jgi:hypothetical protein